MHMKILSWGAILSAAFVPALSVNAALDLENLNLSGASLLGFVNALIPLVFALALLFFLWGLAKFILNAGDEEAREGGKKIMIWGVVAFVVMVSVWGLVALIRSTLGITGTGNGIGLPSVTPTP